jgi:FAD/FMN-containing dehydrogenase
VDGSIGTFVDALVEKGIENMVFVVPNRTENKKIIEQYRQMREAIPIGAKQRGIKVSADPIVPYGHLADMLTLYQTAIEAAGLDYANFGHIALASMHPTALCKTEEEVKIAQEVFIACGRKVIEWGGSPFAEHGVGDGYDRELLGKEGVEQMQKIKGILDPENKLSPGNLFDMPQQG